MMGCCHEVSMGLGGYRHHLEWSDDEIARLKQLALAGLSPRQIARTMKRTEGAVRAQAAKRGIPLAKVRPTARTSS